MYFWKTTSSKMTYFTKKRERSMFNMTRTRGGEKIWVLSGTGPKDSNWFEIVGLVVRVAWTGPLMFTDLRTRVRINVSLRTGSRLFASLRPCSIQTDKKKDWPSSCWKNISIYQYKDYPVAIRLRKKTYTQLIELTQWIPLATVERQKSPAQRCRNGRLYLS